MECEGGEGPAEGRLPLECVVIPRRHSQDRTAVAGPNTSQVKSPQSLRRAALDRGEPCSHLGGGPSCVEDAWVKACFEASLLTAPFP